MRIVSADWVVPSRAPPIEDGAVAIADDGTIAAVGAAADLGAGEHYAGCVIVPGFVNAHSHLEYAVVRGLRRRAPVRRPGSACTSQRKQALDFDDMVAIATVGAHECLRSGITTIGDCSFSGAAAAAAAATGLRAIVYLEVFGRDATALDRFHELARADRAPCSPTGSRVGVSPHAPYTCTVEVYRACAALGLPQATHLAESAAEREWLRRRRGRLEPAGRLLVPPPGETGIRLLAAAGLLGPGLMAAHCVHADAEEIELLAEHGVGVAHCPRSNGYPRLRRRAARGAPRRRASPCRSRPTARPRRRRSTCSRSSAAAIVAARARAERPDALSAATALELATLGGARVLGMDDRVGSLVAGQAGRPDRRLARRTRRSIPLKILLWPPSSAARPIASQLLWWPASSAT